MHSASHQSVLVDVCPLHLLGFGSGQNHRTTQDIQVLLQDKHGHLINPQKQPRWLKAGFRSLLAPRPNFFITTKTCGNQAAVPPGHKASSPERLVAVFHHQEGAIKSSLGVAPAGPLSRRLCRRHQAGRASQSGDTRTPRVKSTCNTSNLLCSAVLKA